MMIIMDDNMMKGHRLLERVEGVSAAMAAVPQMKSGGQCSGAERDHCPRPPRPLLTFPAWSLICRLGS